MKLDSDTSLRLSLSDLLIIVLAVSLGCALVGIGRSLDEAAMPPESLSDVNAAEWFLLSLSVGLAIAPFPLLASHFFIRKRRAPLSRADWLWMSPTILAIATVMLLSLVAHPLILSIWMCGNVCVVVCGMIIIYETMTASSDDSAELWTERYGPIIAILVSCYLIYDLCANFPVI